MESFLEILRWVSGLPSAVKVILTIIAVLVCAVVIVLLWFPSTAPTNPQGSTQITLDGLRRKLRDTSVQNRELLRIIVDAGPDGIYASKLSEETGLTRKETVTRCAELADAHLIVVKEMTDKLYLLHDDILKVIGPDHAEVLRTMLKNP